MAQFKLYCFGPPRMESNAGGIHFHQRRDLALVVYLAATGQPHSRSALATLLWPESGPQESRSNLRRALHRIRKACGEPFLHVDEDTVCLEPTENLWLDTAAFENLVSNCLPTPGGNGGLSQVCSERLAQSAALYTADFLSGFSLPGSPEFDDWQFFEGERLRARLVEVLVELANHYEAVGEYEQAIQATRRWVALDPLHEPAQRRLMALYARAGQQSAALRQYETSRQLLLAELGVEPEPETVTLYQQIKSRELETVPSPAAPAIQWVVAPAPARSLPFFSTPFVGREREILELTSLLADPGCRLLTLTGPGGMGKTRLAVQSAAYLSEERGELFTEGVFFVPLIALNTEDEIIQAIASAIGYTFVSRGGPPRKQLLDTLRPRRVLLVLDNAEHLIEHVNKGEHDIGWILDILKAAPGINLLVTSRTRLKLQGEQLYPVGGLELPDPGSWNAAGDLERQASSSSALQLFLETARRVQPDFPLTRQSLAAAARVCQLVQGMPLGVELAAAWVEVLSPTEIAIEIERGLDFLEADWRDLPERQRSLRAVFDSSWKSLSEGEREAMQKLTVFNGGFTREAAEKVAGVDLKLLLALNNKSWLQREPGGRFNLHELLCQYAAEKLASHMAAWKAARRSHSAYYAGFLHQKGEAMKGPGQREALSTVTEEFQNIHTAWQVLVEDRQYADLLDCLFPLYRLWRTGTRWADLDLLLNEALEGIIHGDEPGSSPLAASILTFQILTSYFHNYVFEQWKRQIRRAWGLACEPGTGEAMGIWYVLLATEFAKYLDWEAGLARVRNSLDFYRNQGENWSLAFTCASLGELIQERSKADARNLLKEALEIFNGLDDLAEEASTLRLLGNLAAKERAYTEAESCLERSVSAARKAGDLRWMSQSLWDLGQALLNQGAFEKAFQTFEQLRQDAHAAGWTDFEIFALSTYSFEAVRYGDLREAREKRLQCMQLALIVQDPNSIAWSHFEMGEIERVEGDLESARRRYEEARVLFEKAGTPMGLGYYQRGMGDLALARGDFAQAVAHFQESLRLTEQERNDWATAYALIGLGWAETGLGNYEEAGTLLRRGLKQAWELGFTGLALVPIAGLAALRAAQGEFEAATELSACVEAHPVAWRETRAQAAELLATVSAQLAEETAGAAQACGRAVELPALVNTLLGN